MKKKIVWVLGTLVLLSVLFVLLLHSPFVKTKILNYLNKYMSQSLGFSLSAESLDYNLLTLRVSFKKLKAGSHDDPAQIPFFQADALDIQLTPALILRRKLDFKSIRLVRPRVNVGVLDDGSLNIPPQLLQKSGEPLPPLYLRDIFIEDGFLAYRDPAKGLSLVIPAVSLTGVMVSGGKQEIVLLFNLDSRDGKGKGKPGRLVFRDEVLQLEKAVVTARIDNERMDFLLYVSEQKSNETIYLKGRLTVKDARFSLRELEIAAAGGAITGTGDFYPSPPQAAGDKGYDNHLSLTLTSLNLQSPLLTRYMPHPFHTALSGSFDLMFPGFDFKDFRADAALTFAQSNNTTPAKKDHQPFLRGQVMLKLTPGTMTIRDIDLTTPGSTQQGIPGTHIRGSLDIVNNSFSGELSAAVKSEPSIDGHLHFSGQMSGESSAPLIKARLQSKGIHIGSSMTLKPEGTLEYENGQLKTQNMKIHIPGMDSGALTVSGVLPLPAPLPGQPDPLDVTIQAENIDVKQLAAGLGMIIPVKGNLSAEARLLPNRVETKMLLANCAYEQKDKPLIDLGNIDARLKLENKRLSYQIRAADFAVEMTGSGSPEFPFPVQGTVYISSPDFETLSKRQGFAVPAGISGTLKGRLDYRLDLGNIRETAKVDGYIDSFRLRMQDRELENSVPIRFTYDRSGITLEQLALTGPEGTHLRGQGFLPMTDPVETDPVEKGLTFEAQVDTRLLNPLIDPLRLEGRIIIRSRIDGSLAHPALSSQALLQNISFAAAGKGLDGQLHGSILLEKNRLRLKDVKGSLNGGPMTIEGELFFDNSGIQEGQFTLSAAGTYLEIPEGFFSETSTALQLVLDKGKYLLKGTVDMNGGVYKEPFTVKTNLFEYLLGKSAVRGMAVEDETDDSLKDLKLDIRLRTASPVLIDNNMVHSELTADLTLRGTIPQPVLSGRILSKEDGKIYLGGNTYTIDSGVIDFVNPYSIEPDLRVRARTRVREYDIELILEGTPQTFSATFNSTPSLPEPDIIALLTTGKTLADAASSPLNTTGSHALAYISDTLSGKIGQLAKQTTGLDNVRIDGSLIAGRENPGARITVGQRLTSNLDLTLSQSLKDAQNRSWILDYTPVPNLNVQAIKQDKDRLTAVIMREVRFGKKSGKLSAMRVGKKKKAAVVAGIRIEGDTVPGESLIRRKIKLKKGKPFNYFKMQRDTERIRRFLRRRGYLRVRVRAKQVKEDGDNSKTTVLYTITAGPRISIDFSGDYLSRRMKKKVILLWADGRFDRQSIEKAVRYIRLRFIKKGYYRVKVSAGLQAKEREAVHWSIKVRKGQKYKKARFIFQGNRLISRKRLWRLIKSSKSHHTIFTQTQPIEASLNKRVEQTFSAHTRGRALSRFAADEERAGPPEVSAAEVARRLTNYYREQGFLAVKVGEPQIRFDPPPAGVTVTVPISEGSQFKLAKISILGGDGPATGTGYPILDKKNLLKTLAVKEGQVFSAKKISDARAEIAAAYAGKGYNNVRVSYEQHVSNKEGSVDSVFRVEAGPRGVIKEIKVSGNTVTRAAVIRREITFKEGDVLDFRKINKSRKKLYDLGIFERVNFEIENLSHDLPADKESDKNLRVVIRLSELRPFQAKTGLQWNTETAFGAVLELNNNNIAGKSHYLGTSFSIDGKETNFKTYYRFPYFMGRKIATELFAFAGKKAESTFKEKHKGLTLQQQLKRGKGLLFTWNYTWKQTDTADFSAVDFLPTGIETKLNLAYVTTTFSYDRRNSLINSTRGMFFSLSLQQAAALLGSEANFSRLYSEYNIYLPIKGFLVGATSVKIGLGHGLGQTNLPGERLYAGGSTTLRGFKENMVGPLSPETGLPLGGEALFIFRQELRARLHKLFSLVLFADLGNVYETSADFDIFKVRKSAGFGIRLHIASLLLRLDWGFKLDRRPDESPSRIYLSIGQAF